MSYNLDDFNGYLVNIKNGLPDTSFKGYVCQCLHKIINEMEEQDKTFSIFKSNYLSFEAIEGGNFNNLIWNDDIADIFKCYSIEITGIFCENLATQGADLEEFEFHGNIDMTKTAFYLVMSELVDDFVLGGLDNE